MLKHFILLIIDIATYITYLLKLFFDIYFLTIQHHYQQVMMLQIFKEKTVE